MILYNQLSKIQNKFYKFGECKFYTPFFILQIKNQLMQREESIGFLIRYILYHFKSIEERLKWSKAIHKFRQEDKQTLNRAIVKVTGGISDLIGIINRTNPNLVSTIKKDVEKVDLVYYMTLTEQLFDLKTEDLEEITDLIDNHLKKKYSLYGTERQNDTPGNGEGEHNNNTVESEVSES